MERVESFELSVVVDELDVGSGVAESVFLSMFFCFFLEALAFSLFMSLKICSNVLRSLSLKDGGSYWDEE